MARARACTTEMYIYLYVQDKLGLFPVVLLLSWRWQCVSWDQINAISDKISTSFADQKAVQMVALLLFITLLLMFASFNLHRHLLCGSFCGFFYRHNAINFNLVFQFSASSSCTNRALVVIAKKSGQRSVKSEKEKEK